MNKNVLPQIFLQINSLNLDVTPQTGAVCQTQERLCFLLHGRQMPPSCAAQKNWQRLRNTTTSVQAINAGKWASGQIVN